MRIYPFIDIFGGKKSRLVFAFIDVLNVSFWNRVDNAHSK